MVYPTHPLANLFLLSALVCLPAGGPAQPRDEDALPEPEDTWLDHDNDAAVPQAGAGELILLPHPPDGRTLHSENRLTIEPHSLDDGWVQLVQCYHGLDAVPEAEIVYRYREMRELRIASQQNIGQAVTRGQSVQLSNVERDATLCVRMQARILYAQADGSFVLRNGPFHRRFLDGYFPLHVTLEVRFPAASMHYAGTLPEPRPGFTVTPGPGTVVVDSWFAGTLNIEVRFTANQPKP